MKRKTAVKKLMSLGYSRNQAERLMRNKYADQSTKARLVSLAYARCEYKQLGLPISMIFYVICRITPGKYELEVVVD